MTFRPFSLCAFAVRQAEAPGFFKAGFDQSEPCVGWAKRSVPTVLPQWWARFALPTLRCLMPLAIAATVSTAALGQTPPGPPTDAEILALMKTHCVPCHAAEPAHEAFAKAPAGIMLETIAQIAGHAAKIMTQVVVERAMPLGNQTGMTDQERDRIAAWIEGRDK